MSSSGLPNLTHGTPARIRPAGPGDLPAVQALFEEYQRFLGISLSFQGFAEELAGLPGRYAPPWGALLLAEGDGGHPVGCVAMRPIDDAVAEMKRLFVRPEAQGQGLGRLLAEAAIDAARRAGYRAMRLDTFEWMTAAIALYRGMGFATIPPYSDAPVPGLVYLEVRL